MICRDKIGNLHTSYEKMGDSYHLKAFFGVNVSCAMNEVLKFPGLFKLEDLSEYLDSVIVTPKKKLITYVKHTSYLSPKYLAEEESIKPKLLPISGTGNGIFYFYFDQHFAIYDKKKYKVKVSVIDKSIIKANDLKNDITKINKIILNISNQEDITEDIVLKIKETANMAENVQKKQKQIYQEAISATSFDLKTLSNLVDEFKKEIFYIDQKIGLNGKRFHNTKTKDWPENSGLNTFNYFEKEFKKEVLFDFKQERRNTLIISKLPNLPILKVPIQNNIEYLLKNNLKVKKVENLPSFKSSYSKTYAYENEQTLKNKAENYNIDFTSKVNSQYVPNTQDFIIEKSNEQIYVLSGHHENNVTAEIFVPLQEIRQDLLSNSTYLCKTEMTESENQYFILEI